MSGDSRWEHDSLPLEALERINRVCVQFEAVWKQEKPDQEPRIEDYLGATEGEERAVLLRELLLLDLDYRCRLDKPPVAEDYRARFPQDRELIDKVLARLSTRTLLSRSGLHRPASEDRQPQLPSQLGDYELMEMLGEGGMGTVFRARQSSAGRTVALKVIRPDRFTGLSPERRQDTVRRFQVEIQAAAKLEHESIVPVYDVGQIEGQPFFSMRYFEGGSLDSVIGQGPLDGREAAAVMEKIAQAVQHAHSHGVIHRDLKPRNILLDSTGHPYVADFGLAKSLEMREELTLPGEVIGTPAYMAPEQAKGEASVGKAADVYGLGATLYELLTGRPPFRAATVVETQRQVIDNNPVPPRDLNPAIPRDLETICLKCLEKEPCNRYATAEEVAEELTRFRQRRPIHARPIGRVRRFWRWCRRNPVVALLATTASILLLVLGVGGTAVAIREAREVEYVRGLLTKNETLLGQTNTLLKRAEDGERAAETEAREAQRQTHIAKRFLYAADMQLAHAAWKDQMPWHVHARLEGHRPQENEIDLRGWEWYFLRGLLHGDRFTFREHDALIYGLAWSPDGQKIASADQDGILKIWRLHEPKDCVTVELGKRQNATIPEFCRLNWSADGKCILVSREPLETPHELLVCDSEGGRILYRAEGSNAEWNPDSSLLGYIDRRFKLHVWRFGETDSTVIPAMPLECFAWAPEGSKVVASIRHGNVFTMDVESRQKEIEFKRLSDNLGVLAVSWSPHGKQIATASMDGTIKLWDAASGEFQHAFGVSVMPHFAFDFVWSPDSRWLATHSPGRLVHVFDARQKIHAHTFDENAATWSSDSSRLATISSGVLSIWSAESWERVNTLGGHLADGDLVAWQRDGDLIATGSADHTVKIWQATSSPSCRNLPGSRLAWSPDAQHLALAQTDKRICRIDAKTGRELDVWQGVAPSSQVAWSPCGRTLASREHDYVEKQGLILLFEPGRGDPVHTIVIDGYADNLTWSPDGERLAVGIRRISRPSERNFSRRVQLARFDVSRDVQVFHRNDGEVHLRVPHGQGVVWSRDGRILAMTYWSPEPSGISLRNAETGEELRRIGDERNLNHLTFSHDGRHLAAVGRDNAVTGSYRIFVWDTQTGERIHTIDLPGRGGASLAWSPDDRRLVSATTEGVIVWAPEIGQDLFKVDDNDRGCVDAIWSPDGRRLSSINKNMVTIWDATIGYDWDMPPHSPPASQDPATPLTVEVVKEQDTPFDRPAFEHYRNGEWEAARRAVEEAMQQRFGGNCYHWFLLAMTHAKLASLEEAEIWFKRGCEWVESFAREDEELRALRSETATTILDERLNRESAPAEPCGEATKTWTDLLPHMNLETDAVSGNWQQDANEITVAPQRNAIAPLPVRVQGSYELEVEVTRRSGKESVMLFLPVGLCRCNLIVGGFPTGKVSGLERVGGKGANSNSSTRMSDKFVTGRRHTVLARVRVCGDVAAIEVLLDGEPHLTWAGSTTALRCKPTWALAELGRAGIGAYNVPVTFHSARIRSVSGGTVLLSPEKTPYSEIALTSRCGGAKGDLFKTIIPPGTSIAGFRLRAKDRIQSIQPLCTTPDGLMASEHYGLGEPNQEGIAEPGYAVIGLALRGDKQVNGIRVTFSRINGDRLDLSDSYESEWYGSETGTELQIGGDGDPIVGIHGIAGRSLESLGLVVAKTPGPSASTSTIDENQDGNSMSDATKELNDGPNNE